MPDYSLLAQALSRQDGLAPYGMRHLEPGQDITQGTVKGKGYFGEIPMNQGGAMSEVSSAYEQDGNLVSHPLIVPTLTKQEVDEILEQLDNNGDGTINFEGAAAMLCSTPRFLDLPS